MSLNSPSTDGSKIVSFEKPSAINNARRLLGSVPHARLPRRRLGRFLIILLLGIASLSTLMLKCGPHPQFNYLAVLRYKLALGPKSRPNLEKQKEPVGGHLNFTALYPDITSTPWSHCHAAWNSLASIPCGAFLFSRVAEYAWNRDTPMKTLEHYIEENCENECQPALEEAYRRINLACSITDTFILQDYQGFFNTTDLESGPLTAVEALLRRNQHMCRVDPRASPNDNRSRNCQLRLLSRWDFMDSRDVNFHAAGWLFFHFPNTELGSLPCDWCEFDLFNRTLHSWVEGARVNWHWKTNQPVSLTAHIGRVRWSGILCKDRGKWSRIYADAVAHYQEAGALPSNWDPQWPRDDLRRLVSKGPSNSEYPISEMKAEIQHLTSLDYVQGLGMDMAAGRRSANCLRSMVKMYELSSCYAHLSRGELTEMMDWQWELLRYDYCHDRCFEELDIDLLTFCDLEHPTPRTRDLLGEFREALAVRKSYCQFCSISQASRYAGLSWLQRMGLTDWVFNGRPDTPTFMTAVKKPLEELRAAADWWLGTTGEPFIQSKDIYGKEWEALWNICELWTLVTGSNLKETMDYMRNASSPASYLAFARFFHETCTMSTMYEMGGVPFGEDPRLHWEKFESFYGETIGKYVKLEGHPSVVFQVTEYDLRKDELQEIWFQDSGTLWHLIRAERALAAEAAGTFEAWLEAENEHRIASDKAVYDVALKKMEDKEPYMYDDWISRLRFDSDMKLRELSSKRQRKAEIEKAAVHDGSEDI